MAECAHHAQAEEPAEKQIVTAVLGQQSAPSGGENTDLTQPFPTLFKHRSTRARMWRDTSSPQFLEQIGPFTSSAVPFLLVFRRASSGVQQEGVYFPENQWEKLMTACLKESPSNSMANLGD